jgi:hypothetical protein
MANRLGSLELSSQDNRSKLPSLNPNNRSVAIIQNRDLRKWSENGPPSEVRQLGDPVAVRALSIGRSGIQP